MGFPINSFPGLPLSPPPTDYWLFGKGSHSFSRLDFAFFCLLLEKRDTLLAQNTKQKREWEPGPPGGAGWGPYHCGGTFARDMQLSKAGGLCEGPGHGRHSFCRFLAPTVRAMRRNTVVRATSFGPSHFNICKATGNSSLTK